MHLIRPSTHFLSGFSRYWLLFLWFGFTFTPQTLLASPATSFNFVTSASAGITYGVGTILTYQIGALDGSGNTDTAFTGPVTIGLYDTATTQLSDPQAVISAAGITYIGLGGPLTFTSGNLSVTVQMNAGSDSEQLWVQHPTVTGNPTFPGTWVTGPGLKVKGFSTDYYTQDLNGDAIPESYPGSNDLLTDPAVTNFTDLAIQVPNSASITGSAAYVIGNIFSGYAYGGAQVVPSIWLKKTNNSNSPTANFEVIIDYNGDLADFDNPAVSDTVFTGSTSSLSSGSWGKISTATRDVTHANFQPFMQGGRVILRVWSTNAASNPISLRYSSAGAANMSSVSIPYSSANTLPVKASLSPLIVSDNAVTTLTYTVLNQYSAAISYLSFQIPNTPAPTSQYWGVGTVTANLPGTASVVSTPSASGPGTVTFDVGGGAPISVNGSVTFTIPVTVTDKTYSNWSFQLLSALTGGAVQAPIDNTNAFIETLGVPGSPQAFSAVPINFAAPGSGGAVSLSWTPPAVIEGATQYVLTGGAGGPVTIAGIGTTFYIDNSAVNLTGYTYSLVAKNPIASSPPAVYGPVTAFVNPGPPTGVTALSGGTSVVLNWTAPVPPAGSFPVTGYQIWQDTSPGMGSAVSVAAVTSGPSTITGLSAGTTYYYAISSMDNQYSTGLPGGAHDSDLSSPIVSGFPPGNPPTGLTGTLLSSSPGIIGLNWTAPVNNLYLPIDYQIYKALSPGSVTFYTTVGSAATTFTDSSGLAQGSSYRYMVKAVDSLGVTTNASTTITQSVGPSPPGTPTPTSYSNSITLVWQANAPSQGVVSYRVYQNGVPIGTPVPATSGFVTAGVPVSGSTLQGTNYFYQVVAVDGIPVTSLLSAGVSAALLPLAPTILSVTSNPLTTTTMAVTWATPVPAEVNLTNYRLDQQILPAGFAAVTTLSSGIYNFAVTTLTSANAGNTIVYRLVSQNISGFGPASTTFMVQVPPNPVSNPGTTSTTAAIAVTWVDATAAAENVTLYYIYRDGVPIGSVPIGTNTYNDSTGLTTGQNYVYTVKAFNAGGTGFVGGYSLASSPVTAALKFGPPQSFSAVVQANKTNVDLNWTAPASSANLTGYSLYRSKTNTIPTTVYANLPVTQAYTDINTTADAGTTFFYFLKGVNISGGGTSILAGVQIPPNPPTALGAVPASNNISVTWVAPAIGVNETVSSYTVYRGTSANPTTPLAANIIPTNYTDSTASPGTDYYYRVTATNVGSGATIVGGESFYSAGNLLTGRLPQAASGVTAISVDTSNNIAVTWTSVLGVDPNATAVSLIVNNTNASSGSGAITINLGSTAAVSYFDNGVFSGSVTGESPDTTYYYWLQATNTYGAGALGGPATKLTYPAPVSLSSVSVGPSGSRVLSWVTVGGGDVTQYVVYRQLQGASSFVSMGTVSVPVTGLGMPVTVSNPVLPGKIYNYRITAINATGEGTSATTITYGSAPTAPSGVTAVSGLSTVSSAVSLSWSDPTTLSEGVTGFTVYRSNSNATTAGYGVPIATGLTNFNYLDPSLTGNSIYYYIVAAQSNNGRESTWTTANAVTVTAFAAPNAATGVTAVAGNAQATVSWLAATATTYPVSIYNIYRVSGGVTTLAPASTTGLSLIDTGLTNGVTYSYLVQTVDNQGHLSAFSAPSGTVLPVVPPNPPTGMGVVNGINAIQVSWTPAVAGTLPIGSYILFRQSPPGVGSFVPVTQIAGNLTGFVDNNNGTGLNNLTSYSYYVQAVDSSGITFIPHISANSTPVTGTPAAANINPPNSVSGNPGNGFFLINWVDSYTPGSNPVTGYAVFRSSNGSSGPYSSTVTIASGIQTYNDVSVANGTTYYYYLVAMDNAGFLSSGSATVFGTPVAPPLAPTPVTEADGNASVTLDWTASAGSGSVSIANYVIYRAIPPGSAPATLGPTTGPVTTFTNTGLTNGTPVEYFVSAVNSNGTTGVLSTPVTAFPYNLTAPVVSSMSSGTGVNVSWTAPGTNSYPPVATYTVYRSTTSGVYNLSAPLTTLAGTSFSDTTGTLGQLYYYVVTATDNKGHVSPLSTEIFDGTATPPGPPTNVTVTQGSTELLLDWSTPVSIAGNLPVSFYIVTRTSGAPVTLPASQTWYLDTPLTDPSTVNYTVTAVDAAGLAQTDPAHQGTPAPGTGTTNSTVLNPPSGLTATATGSASIQLTWDPANDLGRPVQSYAIYRSNSLPVATASPLVVLNNPIAGPVTSYSDTGLSPNTTYYYVLQSVEAGTLTHSGNSNHAVATTIKPSTPPVPVTVGQLGLDANVFLPLSGQKLGIYYNVPNAGVVEIDIYNVAGKQIATLVPGVAAANTALSVFWDGKDRNGNLVASGLYIVEIRATGFHQLKKVAVVK